MIAAIYARKSNRMTSDHLDDDENVKPQRKTARIIGLAELEERSWH